MFSRDWGSLTRCFLGFLAFAEFAFRFDVLCWREQSFNSSGGGAVCFFSPANAFRSNFASNANSMENRGHNVAAMKFLCKGPGNNRMRRAETAGFLFSGGSPARARSLLTKGRGWLIVSIFKWHSC